MPFLPFWACLKKKKEIQFSVPYISITLLHYGVINNKLTIESPTCLAPMVRYMSNNTYRPLSQMIQKPTLEQVLHQFSCSLVGKVFVALVYIKLMILTVNQMVH